MLTADHFIAFIMSIWTYTYTDVSGLLALLQLLLTQEIRLVSQEEYNTLATSSNIAVWQLHVVCYWVI